MRAGISPIALVTDTMAAMVLVLMAVMVIQRPDLVLMVTLKSRMVFSWWCLSCFGLVVVDVNAGLGASCGGAAGGGGGRAAAAD